MPIYRGPDGKIIEERTRKVSAEEELLTRNVAKKASNTVSNPSEEQTRKVDPAAPTLPPDSRISDSDEKTRILKSNHQRSERSNELVSDPAVGWLAIVAGPGTGEVVQLGYGANSIGRGEADRICLNFGDDLICRKSHAIVTYDPRGRKFYLQHGDGGGKNLTYLDGKPVLSPCELPVKSTIQLGNTRLYFLPLCGEEFDWQDLETDDS